MTKTRKVGRDAGTGRFIPVKVAQRRKKTAVFETIKVKKPKSYPLSDFRAGRSGLS